ncbi:MAG TPA: enolase C-terminal domain-like protein [Acidimicrobiia bacterium]|nr:enolase C-terminal domain-like protein [Acidimicrobiia bacterium]
MQLTGVELVRADLAFRTEIGTAAGVHRSRPVLYVRVVARDLDGAQDVEGWGECAALGEATSVDPPLDEVERLAIDRGVPRLDAAAAARKGRLPAAAEVPQIFGGTPADRMLAAAFEMAVSDAELRAEGSSLAESLAVGPGFEMVPVGAVVGIPAGRGLDDFLAATVDVLDQGATRLRMKIEPGWDHEPVRAVRAAHPDLVIQVDANGSYRATDDDVAALARLADLGVLCIEQPLPPADLVALAQLAERLPLPICLDESLTTPRRVVDALRNGACAMACLKPGRLGGMRATRRAHAACAEAGVPAFVGGFFETGLGRSSNLALAARLSQDATGLVSDLGDPAGYLSVDPCGYPPVVDGWVRVPAQPGVGHAPDAGVLERLEAPRRWFPATYT